MSLIQLKMRPWVEFDPANRQHRQWYAEYLQNRNWSSCPVRFVDPSDSGNLAMSMQATLVKYYAQKEFKRLPKKPKTTMVSVDSLTV